MQELQHLSEKLTVLLKKHTQLLAENTRLKKTISEQAKAMDALYDKLSFLEQNMNNIQMGKMLSTAGEKDGMRKQLDNVIGEIDKILNTLND